MVFERPAFIAADLTARIQALPKVKLLGYYSDAYKLEFILPKFNMYRKILAETLAGECVRGRGWTPSAPCNSAKSSCSTTPGGFSEETCPVPAGRFDLVGNERHLTV